jgi:hypothetical protein
VATKTETADKSQERVQEVFVDGVSSVAIHNGVVRVQCYVLTAEGKPKTTLELRAPQSGVKNLVDALGKLTK